MEIIAQFDRQLAMPVYGIYRPDLVTGWIDHPVHMGGVQWSSLGSATDHHVWVARRDIVAMILQGQGFRAQVSAPSIFEGGSTVSSTVGHLRHSQQNWGIRTWPYNPYDFDYPRNPIYAAKAVIEPVHGNYRGERNTIHSELRGKRNVSRHSGHEWTYKVSFDTPRTVWGYTFPGHSRLRTMTTSWEDAQNALSLWPSDEIPTGRYQYGGYPMWVNLTANYGIAQYDSHAWPNGDLIGTLATLSHGFFHTWIMPEGIFAWEVTNLRYEWANAHSIEWSYDLSYTVNGGLSASAKWSIKSGVHLKVSGDATPANPVGWYQPRYMNWVSWYESTLKEAYTTYLDIRVPMQHVSGAAESATGLGVWQGAGPYCVGPANPSPSYSSLLTDALSRERNYHARMDVVVDRMMPELRRSAILAVCNAVSNTMKFLENNYLEVLSELDSLPELIPDLKGLTMILKHAPWSKIRSGLSLGRWYAGSYLQFAFGIAPTIGVIEELTRLGPKLAEYLTKARLLRQQRVRGSFSFDFSSEDLELMGVDHFVKGRAVSLTTRACLDLSFPDSQLLLGIANLYGLGLAPLPSQWYETLPFAFAVDWFARLSKRLSAVEMSALSALLKISTIIMSYDVRIPETDTEYLDLGGIPSDMWYKAFRRELLSELPSLADGKVDYLRATSGPPQGILAALLYQFSGLGSGETR